MPAAPSAPPCSPGISCWKTRARPRPATRRRARSSAPIVLRESGGHYFDIRRGEGSPYMLLAAPVRQEIRTPLPPGYDKTWGIDKLNHKRSLVPAITHVDYSARVQTVDRERNPL